MFLQTEKLTKTQKKETIDRLFSSSTPSLDFYLMMTLSTIIIAMGLMLNNVAVIIGGMLIAPMLFPILSLSMGVVTGYPKLIQRGGVVIIQSILIIAVMSLLISLLFIEKELNPEIISRSVPSFAFLIIAFASGAAVAYAVTKPNISEVLPGVAITVSLVPPLASAGISLAFLKLQMALGAIQLFALNLVGIVFAAMIVFALMNFYEAKEQIHKKIKAEEKKRDEINEKKEFENIKEIETTLKEATKALKKKLDHHNGNGKKK